MSRSYIINPQLWTTLKLTSPEFKVLVASMTDNGEVEATEAVVEAEVVEMVDPEVTLEVSRATNVHSVKLTTSLKIASISVM